MKEKKSFWRWLIDRYWNRETIAYVVFGTLTTVVDFVTYNISFRLLSDITGEDYANGIANVVAWVVAVAFSYFVNKVLVFKSKAENRRALLKELGGFLTTRVFSLVISEMGMIFLFSGLHWDENLSKALTSILVMLINYICLKHLVFRQKP